MQDPPRGPAPLQFKLETVVQGPRAMLLLAGELDVATVPQLEFALGEAELRGVEEIVVDLERLTFIDSTGLHALVASQRRFNRDGPALLIRRPREEVARTIALVGLDTVLRIVED
jgi:anti-sigma B factor antagonist